MTLFDDLFEEVDARWSPAPGEERIALHVIGSAALFLQTAYERGTKDGDVLETHAISESVRFRLLAIAGPRSALHQKHGVYLEVVSKGLPFLPHEPLWHHYPLVLRHFDLRVLDVADVVVSKLKRWNATDRDDVRQMVAREYLPRERLIERFVAVVENHQFDGRSDVLIEMRERVREIESDWFGVDPTDVVLPDTVDR